MDTHVGAAIYRNLIGPSGLLKKKTRILVTHGLKYLRQAHSIVVLKHGRVSEAGSYVQLAEVGNEFSRFLAEYDTEVGGVKEETPRHFSRQLSRKFSVLCGI